MKKREKERIRKWKRGKKERIWELKRENREKKNEYLLTFFNNKI